MKSITYARLTLLAPYFVLTVSILGFISSYYHLKAGYFPNIGEIISSLILYTSLLWFVPYTVLTIGLLAWSIRKSFQQFQIAYIGSPILFAVLFSLFFIAIGATAPAMGGTDIMLEMAMVASVTVVLAIVIIIVGYLFVGISLLVYKALFELKIIRD
jgi:hypothetical protein